jgi:type IV secretion system protein VirB6
VLRGGEAAAADGLWKASAALFMATAGALSISIIAVGILLTVGPIFIALALFEATRGLFLGWARALISAALAPMVCWMTITVMLVVLQPWLARLNPTGLTQAPDLDAATVCIALVFIFAAAQAAVVAGAAVIGAGLEFGSRARSPSGTDNRAPAARDPVAQDMLVLSRVERLAMQLSRAPSAGSLGAPNAPSAMAAGRVQGGDGGGRGVLTGAAGQIGDVYRRDGFRDRFRKPEARSR